MNITLIANITCRCDTSLLRQISTQKSCCTKWRLILQNKRLQHVLWLALVLIYSLFCILFFSGQMAIKIPICHFSWNISHHFTLPAVVFSVRDLIWSRFHPPKNSGPRHLSHINPIGGPCRWSCCRSSNEAISVQPGFVPIPTPNWTYFSQETPPIHKYILLYKSNE